jgi:hypothetical protein
MYFKQIRRMKAIIDKDSQSTVSSVIRHRMHPEILYEIRACSREPSALLGSTGHRWMGSEVGQKMGNSLYVL